MGSDKARDSYDEKQQYRSVVMQQGRVTLDADWNEAQEIIDEEFRKEALDFVGPVGTPDDGYRISVPKGLTDYDFQIGAGTMYVGGMRVSLPPSTGKGGISTYLHQPDWISPAPPKQPAHEFVYLTLDEREVSAVEDASLREVALGGPDTAGRTRLIQRIHRASVGAQSCGSALAEVQKSWKAIGLTLDPRTMRLDSAARLQVGFEKAKLPPDLCEPTAQGGYLGAENQLIRVQITAQNKLIWGYDNASFLYRIDNVAADNQTLRLKSRPVDDFHAPRAQQVVEALRATTRLANGEYVAESAGHASALLSGYKSDDQTVMLKDALPPDYLMPKGTPRLFLRVWEQELTFTPGTPFALGETGVQVTLKVPAGQKFHVGDFWSFAVRPSTPTQLYPERYLTPQPPEGPRVWACPLAVIEWQSPQQAAVADCREQFDNLVELSKRKSVGGCCTVVIKPEDVKQRTLQSFLDDQIKAEPLSVCLKPGIYELTEPIRLHGAHSNLTFEGCRGGVVLRAAHGSESKFLDGLIVLDKTAHLTIKGLQLEMPLIPLSASGQTFAGLEGEQLKEFERAFGGDVAVSIGIRTVHSSHLTVEDCRFNFSSPAARQKTANTFSVGIFAGGHCTDLIVRRNSFTKPAPQGNAKGEREIALGYALAPSLQLDPRVGGLINSPADERSSAAVLQRSGAHLLPSLLDGASFRDNEFSGLTLAALVWSDTGQLEISGNAVSESYAGFWLVSQRWLNARNIKSLRTLEQEVDSAAARARDEAKQTQPAEAHQAMQITLDLLFDPKLLLAGLGVLVFPLPDGFEHSAGDNLFHPVETGATAPETPLLGRLSEVTRATLSDAPPTFHEMAQPETTGPTQSSSSKTTDFIESKQGSVLNRIVAQVNELISSFAAAVNVAPPVHLSLDFSRNIVEAIATDGSSGTALLVWDTDQSDNSTLTMSGNRLRNNSLKLPTATLLMLDRASATGNLFLNEQVFHQTPFWSVLLIPGATTNAPGTIATAGLLAITGNVFKGWPLLPVRFTTATVPSPMNTWHFLNTHSW
ncbi:MAG: hypothetical protein QOE33_3461 [Acidobacteriota bacterium]|nr:hypothetical protein [Acidobacteriota bacterium]